MAERKAKGPGAGVGKGVRKPPDSQPARGRPAGTGEESHLPWNRRNYMILGAGGAAIAVGFLLLVLGDTTIAPVLLVGGYLGLIPWGIISSVRKEP